MYEKENAHLTATAKAKDYANEVYEILENLSPEEKRRALRGAEEKINLQFEIRKNEIQQAAKELEAEWMTFRES